MKRRASVDLAAVVTALGATGDDDQLDRRMLDAAEQLMRSGGLRRWSLDDVARRADIGRSSIYRRFGGRDELVHAVLARELRSTLDAIGEAIEASDDLESKAVAAVTAALAALEGSVVDALLESDPETFLPFLTTDAGPLLAIATAAITQATSAHLNTSSPELSEAAARFGLSFILTRDTVLPLDDPVALDRAVRRVIRPFLVAFGITPAKT